MSARFHEPARLRLPGCLIPTVLALALPLAGPAQDVSTGAGKDPVEFRVDSESIWLRVLVFRGGLLGGFGHNHVISHGAIEGTVLLDQDPLRSQINLEFAVNGLIVDDPTQRTVAGPDFPGQISAQDIAGTRANMLGRKLLQAEQFPSIQIRSRQISGSLPDLEVEASVIVRGAEYTVTVPAHVELSADLFVASGEIELRHADLGLKPFKAAFGTLRVRDGLVLQYEISGSRFRGARDIHFIP